MYLLFIWHGGYVMILRRAYQLRGPLEGVGWALEIEAFLGPEIVTNEASAIWAQKKLDFQGGPTPSNGQSNGSARLKIIKYKIHKKTGTLVILCT
jgi:hypothetical protein